MAEPVTRKIDTLPTALTVANNDELIVMDVSESAVNMTKKMTMSQIPISLASQLGTNVVENAKIKDGAVTNAKLGADAVTGAKIAAGTIASTNIADGAVTNSKLGADAVNGAKIADNAIGSEHIISKAVTAAKIADNTITAAQIANGTITATQMAAGAAVANIATGGIATAKLAAGAVTEDKLGAIKRTVAIPVFGREDAVIVKNFVRIFPWPPMLNGHVVVGASAVLLGAVSSSGAVAMTLTNQNGAMATISIAAGAWSASAASINTSYDEAASFAAFSINVTSAGSGAIGLTVYLEVLG